MKKNLTKWAAATVVVAAGVGVAHGQDGKLSNDVLRIGVLTDISGVYADISGKGAVGDTLRRQFNAAGDHRLTELPCHINDPAFAAALADALRDVLDTK